MTIIEVRGPGGQLLERVRSGASSLSVGRAFDNDIILEDEYVSAHHLRLTRGEEGWEVEDLDSLNGVSRGGGAASNGVIRSGEELGVGHTTLRIFDDHHPTEPPLPLDGIEARLSRLGENRVWMGLVGVSALVTTTGLLWQSVTEFKPEAALSPVLEGVLTTTAIAAVWALVGRVLRHKALFRAHLSVWLSFSLLTPLLDFVAQFIGYNASSAWLEETLGTVLSPLLMAATLWASLTLATPLRSQRRLASAIGVALLFTSMNLADEVRWDFEFSSNPGYYDRLQGPSLLWAAPEPQDALIDRLPALFERAEAEAADEDDEA